MSEFPKAVPEYLKRHFAGQMGNTDVEAVLAAHPGRPTAAAPAAPGSHSLPAGGALPSIPAYPRFGGLPVLPALQFLATRVQWVAWMYIAKLGEKKPRKVPYNPVTGREAKSNDPSTWSTYAKAASFAKRKNNPGVGFMLTPEDDLTGIDIDDCRDPATGALEPWAAEVIALAETHTEVSPSGRGVRMFALDKVASATAFQPAGVGIYGRGRYLTVTGNPVEGTPDTVHPAPKTLAALLARVGAFKAAAQAAKAAVQGAPAAARPPSAGEAGGFFRAVNSAALADLAAWVPALLPAAVPNVTGYRVKSMALGRDLEEELSITPMGIKDFGIHDQGDAREGRRSAIDLVMEHGAPLGVSDALGAAMWLCERLGVTRESLGWKGGAQDTTTGPRAVITIEGGNIQAAADAAALALVASGAEIYQRMGKPVRPVAQEVAAAHDRMTRAARLADIKIDGLVYMLSRYVEFQRFDKREDKFRKIDPPRDISAALLSREGVELPFQTVAGCITAPTLRSDGSLLLAPGYDAATRLYHHVDPDPSVPAILEAPTRADAEAALHLLNGLLGGFPFVGPVDRAVALSALMMATLRGGMPVAPLHLIWAHTPGTGKSFLVDLASTIATGRLCPVSSGGSGEEELEKRLTGLLLSGAPVVSLDNVNGDLDGVFLCQAIERPLVALRRLGTSDTFEVECRAALFATGNNTLVKGDMIRRTLTCNLDAGVEDPEKRSFRFDPVKRVLADRGAYVAAVLTIARAHRAYTASGGRTACPPLGSFGGYSTAVREPLMWLGIDDPTASMEATRAADPERAMTRELFSHWESTLGLGTAFQAHEVADKALLAHPSGFGAFLLLNFPGHSGSVNTLKLGRFLARMQGRPISGRKLEMRPNAKHGHAYRLVQAVTG